MKGSGQVLQTYLGVRGNILTQFLLELQRFLRWEHVPNNRYASFLVLSSKLWSSIVNVLKVYLRHDLGAEGSDERDFFAEGYQEAIPGSMKCIRVACNQPGFEVCKSWLKGLELHAG